MEALFNMSQYGTLVDYYAPRFLLALLCGFLIGFERQIKNKSFGLRTSILICLGSMIFASIHEVLYAGTGVVADPARITAQIVSGIGFLGAGVIITDRGSVYGITTAATIWISAAVGVLVGVGLYPIALFGTVVVVLVLVLLKPLDNILIRRKQEERITTYTTSIHTKDIKEVYALVKQYRIHILESSVKKDDKNNIKIFRITYRGKQVDKRDFLDKVTDLDSTSQVKDSLSFGSN